MSDIQDDLNDLGKREQVKRLKRKYEKADSFIKETASGGLDIVRGGFNITHFPLELTQNADDEGATNLLFEVDEEKGELYVFDDGAGFDPDGLKAVCQQGQSPKDPRQQIGFMGIGFKSMFEISDNVRIHSNGYHFGFSIDDEDEDDGLDAVTPHWVPEEPPEPRTVKQKEYTTRIVASIKNESDDGVEQIKQALEEDNLSPSVFLFLDSLSEIEIRSRQDTSFSRSLYGGHVDTFDEPEGVSEARELYKKYAEGDPDPENKLSDDDLVQIRRTGNSDGEEQWVVFRDIWDIDKSLRRPRLRKNLETSDLFIAFRISQDGRLIELVDGGSVRISPVHSYLPLSELDVDIDFLIHADFDLNPSREGIRSNSEWNDRAAEVVREQCLQNVLEVLDDHSEWWRQSHLIIPQSQRGNNLIISDILEEFRSGFAKSYDFIRDMDRQKIVPVGQVRDFTEYARSSFESDEIEEIIDYRPVHRDQRKVLERLEKSETKKLAEILKNSDAPDVLERHTNKENTTDWFAQLYQNLATEEGETNTSRGTVRRALNNRIILKESGELSVGRSSRRSYQDDWEVFLPAEDGSSTVPFDDMSNFLDIIDPEVLDTGYSDYSPRELFIDFDAESIITEKAISEALIDDGSSLSKSKEECVSILDATSELSDDDSISAWLTALDYDEYRISQLRDLVWLCKDESGLSDCVDWTRGNWIQLSNSEKRASVRMCKAAYCDTDTDSNESFGFLRLPTASGWSRPENVLPSSDLSPNYDFDMIEERYPRLLRTRNLELIDESIAKSVSGWQDFLDHLGVADENKLDRLVGDVGEAFVENQSDRRLHKVKQGMDFRSDDGDLLIEVKSTKQRSKKQVHLTSAQYDNIKATSGKTDVDYYVYPVVNVLTSPEIRPSPVEGDELLDEIDAVSVDISGFQ
jgi:hypothetical protein